MGLILEADGYQPSAFYFKVVLSGTMGTSDTSFKEVSGLSTERGVEEVEAGGENSYVYKLPKHSKNPNLVLKRGIATIDSAFAIWCKTCLEHSMTVPIVPMPLLVYLMNEYQTPIRSWSVTNAYPIKWDVDNFESQKNEVAIETIELAYHGLTRLS